MILIILVLGIYSSTNQSKCLFSPTNSCCVLILFITSIILIYYVAIIIFEIFFEINLHSRSIYLSSQSLLAYDGVLLKSIQLIIWLLSFGYLLYSYYIMDSKNDNYYKLGRFVLVLVLLITIFMVIFVIDAYSRYQMKTPLLSSNSSVNYASQAYTEVQTYSAIA